MTRVHYRGFTIKIGRRGYKTYSPFGDFAFGYEGREPKGQLLEMAYADIDDSDTLGGIKL